MNISQRFTYLFSCLFLLNLAIGQVINVGSGSYTKTFPGTDQAGRNNYPTGQPITIGKAATLAVPTNDWWSAKIKNNHCSNLFNYPLTLKTVNSGIVSTYIPWGVIDDISPITIGVSGLNVTAAKVSDFTDWTVTMDWSNNNHNFTATAGIGMPFLYFTKDSNDIAEVNITQGTVTINNEIIQINNARNGADFAIFAPKGSSWSKNGTKYTSTLNGKNYWSMAFIPLDAPSIPNTILNYKKYAYVFPKNTTTTWNYDSITAKVTTKFEVEVDVKEGADSIFLMGLLPHQWANIASTSSLAYKQSYTTVRGELKTAATNSFSVENKFYGILPTLPYLDNYSTGFSPQTLNNKINALQNDGLATWTDSYNEGQVMNRLIQTARIADEMGNTEARNKIITTIKNRLEDWLTINGNEVAFMFYYNDDWTSLIGYPAGHGQDGNLNDHHFHWGYFIHAASFLEQYEPGWAAKYGDMINLLVQDAACDQRDNSKFPFLRNFSPYAGHCWANGFASFPQGNDQESTSESMQFNSSLIHWGQVTGNTAIRDLGIYLYTTEQSAIEEYWFDKNERNFSPTQQYSLVSRVWGNSYDNGTFWTSDIAASYGIEMYPIHGGSLYLGHDTNYVKKLWAEIEKNTGILSNEANVNLWHDVMWEYLAFIDPSKAINMYNSYPNRSLKFGISDAQTYHWLHAMNALGKIDVSITANHPLSVAFTKSGSTTYVGQNYQADTLEVTFSDGYKLKIPPHSLGTSKDVPINATLTSSYKSAYFGGSVQLELKNLVGIPSKVAFYSGDLLLGEMTSAPYVFKATNLTVGKHNFYARLFDSSNFNVSNIVTVLVGEQLPYGSQPSAIPGTLNAAHFDIFEGGSGSGISYLDLSQSNAGDFRTDEFVDASSDPNEGDIVTWINRQEWLEYTIDVEQAGYYTTQIRYASDVNTGLLQFELNDDTIKSNISFAKSGGWDKWTTKTTDKIPLKAGTHVLRLRFVEGGINLGKITFSYNNPLDYNQPTADAGENKLVVIPAVSTTVDGGLSISPGNLPLTYHWTQVYGPSTLVFSSASSKTSTVQNIEEGVYLVRLEISNGNDSDKDDLYIISSKNTNVPPKVSIFSPIDNSIHLEQDSINISALASDLIGYVEEVHFYEGNDKIGSSLIEPFTLKWAPNSGNYTLTAIAIDNSGDSAISAEVNVQVKSRPPCRGTSANGDFDYKFSDDKTNPTITFIPSKSGVGSPTCILYYGTNSNNMPGYGVTPNTPFKMTAGEGSTVYVYYTYSYPGQGEKNTAQNKIVYKVGSCKLLNIRDSQELQDIIAYPNPVKTTLHLTLTSGKNKVSIINSSGVRIKEGIHIGSDVSIDMSQYASGLYFIKIINQKEARILRVIKE